MISLTQADLIALAVLVLITVVVFLLGRYFLRAKADPVRERLSAIARGESGGNGKPAESGSLAESLATQLPQTKRDNGVLEKELRQAGFYRPTARRDFLALRNGLVILTLIVAGTAAVVIGPESQDTALLTLGIGLVVALLCWAIPRTILMLAARRRVNRIRRSLPYALDMLAMCVSGGLSLRDALGHTSREIHEAHPELAIELLIVRQQADMTSLEMAFRQFAERIDAPEVLSLSALVAQGQQLGTNVASSVREYADLMRLERRQTADERSNRAGISLLFPIILCLLPAAMIFLWGPAIVEMTDFLNSFSSDDVANVAPPNGGP